MKFRWTVFALAFLLAGGAFLSWAVAEEESDEQKVTMEQLPAPVKATLVKEAGTGKISDITKDTEDGKASYEAAVTIDGKEWEITIAEDGQLTQKKLEQDDEKKLTMDQLPAAVKATLVKEAGAGKIGDITQETKDGKTSYEADVTIDTKEWEIKISQDGQLIQKKLEQDDEKDEHDEKEQGKH